MSHPDDGVLQELLDGELAAADEAAVRAHLASCAACTALLEELRVTQVEATSIVSRLELNPPLRRAAPRRTGLRRGNLRLLGLAASTVLVAGTSWLLLRTSPGASRALYRVGDSGANALLEMPPEERDQASAATPAPAAAPAVPTNTPAAADERKALADASPVVSGKDAPRPRRKEETAAPAANRPSDAVVAQSVPAPSLTVADAEARLGWKVRTIEGLTPQSVELVQVAPDSASGVRQRYQVGRAAVVLVQQAVASDEMISTRGGRADEAAGARPADGKPAGEALKRDRAQGLTAGKVAAGSIKPTRVWRSGGLRFELSGALPADSLDALMRRVR
jgi:hypothetical protein